MKEKFKRIVFYFLLFAILGWIWEVGVSFIQVGHFVNRGTLFGPWVPIYGFGGVIIILFSEKFKNPWALFIAAFFISGILEFFTSLYLEKFYHARWWDYSDIYFDIDGRICLEFLLVFALMSCICVYLFVPAVDKLYAKINSKNSKAMTAVLAFLLTIVCLDAIIAFSNPNRDYTIHQASPASNLHE